MQTSGHLTIGSLSKTAEDNDGNISKTIRLITQDKPMWICETKWTFVPSCSRVRHQLLHFHVWSCISPGLISRILWYVRESKKSESHFYYYCVSWFWKGNNNCKKLSVPVCIWLKQSLLTFHWRRKNPERKLKRLATWGRRQSSSSE